MSTLHREMRANFSTISPQSPEQNKQKGDDMRIGYHSENGYEIKNGCHLEDEYEITDGNHLEEGCVVPNGYTLSSFKDECGYDLKKAKKVEKSRMMDYSVFSSKFPSGKITEVRSTDGTTTKLLTPSEIKKIFPTIDNEIDVSECIQPETPSVEQMGIAAPVIKIEGGCAANLPIIPVSSVNSQENLAGSSDVPVSSSTVSNNSVARPKLRPVVVEVSCPEITDAELLSLCNGKIAAMGEVERGMWQGIGVVREFSASFSTFKNSKTQLFQRLKTFLLSIQKGTFILEYPCGTEYERVFGEVVYQLRNRSIASILDKVFWAMEKYTRYRLSNQWELRRSIKMSMTDFIYDIDSTVPVRSYFRSMLVTEVDGYSDAPTKLKSIVGAITAITDGHINGDNVLQFLIPAKKFKHWSESDRFTLYESVYKYLLFVHENDARFNPRKHDGLLYRACLRWANQTGDFYDIDKCKKLPDVNGEFMSKFFKEWEKEIVKG